MEIDILIIIFGLLIFSFVFNFVLFYCFLKLKQIVDKIEEKLFELHEKKFNDDLVEMIEDKVEEKLRMNKVN